MMVTEGTGNAQSMNSVCITSNAIFSRFIFDIFHKQQVDSSQKWLDISLWFLLQVKVHNIDLKTARGFVDNMFTS